MKNATLILRRVVPVLLALILTTAGLSAQSGKTGKKKKKEKKEMSEQETPANGSEKTVIADTFSYSLGLLLANNLKQQGISGYDEEELLKGLRDALNDKAQLDYATANLEVQKGMRAERQAKATANLEAGRRFLEENAKRKGVKVTDSGLQYEILKKGNGPKPGPADKVKVHYHGTLIDGTVFDSSVERGQPISFPVNGVIKGWQEALQMMPVGSKWKLYIPSELAYGERGAGAAIPPNAVLIFEVELLGIEGK